MDFKVGEEVLIRSINISGRRIYIKGKIMGSCVGIYSVKRDGANTWYNISARGLIKITNISII